MSQGGGRGRLALAVIHFEGQWKGWALEMNLTTSHSCSKTHVLKITKVPVSYMSIGLNDFDGANPLLGPLEGVGPEN